MCAAHKKKAKAKIPSKTPSSKTPSSKTPSRVNTPRVKAKTPSRVNTPRVKAKTLTPKSSSGSGSFNLDDAPAEDE
jgi:hypothetical protein